jgi:alpha-N-arabinofuranosidase
MSALGHQLGGGLNRRHGRDAYQAISFHYYTVPGPWEHKGSATEFDREEYYRTLHEAQRLRGILAGHAAVMDAYDPERHVGLVLDEWGTWFDVEPGTNPGFLFQQNTLRDALVAGVHFDAFHDHAERLVMANIAQTVNVLQAMILTDGDALVRTPTYHVFEMNKGHHDAQRLRLALQDVPSRGEGESQVQSVSASASIKDGRVLVSLTNLDADEPVELVLNLRGDHVGAPVGRLLAATALTAHNTPADPDEVCPGPLDEVQVDDGVLSVRLPAHSFATVQLSVRR